MDFNEDIFQKSSIQQTGITPTAQILKRNVQLKWNWNQTEKGLKENLLLTNNACFFHSSEKALKKDSETTVKDSETTVKEACWLAGSSLFLLQTCSRTVYVSFLFHSSFTWMCVNTLTTKHLVNGIFCGSAVRTYLASREFTVA